MNNSFVETGIPGTFDPVTTINPENMTDPLRDILKIEKKKNPGVRFIVNQVFIDNETAIHYGKAVYDLPVKTARRFALEKRGVFEDQELQERFGPEPEAYIESNDPFEVFANIQAIQPPVPEDDELNDPEITPDMEEQRLNAMKVLQRQVKNTVTMSTDLLPVKFPERDALLLTKFNTVEALTNATMDDLIAAGFSEATAKKIGLAVAKLK